MIELCNLSAEKRKKRLEKNVVLTDFDLKAIWFAIKQGLVTSKTLEVIYLNYACSRNLNKRLNDLAAHGYLRKASYKGTPFGNLPRLDRRCFLPTLKAARMLELNIRLPRVDDENSWICYFTDNLTRQLCKNGIQPEDVYTSIQLKKGSPLNSVNTGYESGIPLHEKGMPFHLAVRTAAGSLIYVYFFPMVATLSKKEAKKGAKQIIRPIKTLMSNLSPGDLLYIACSNEHFMENVKILSEHISDELVCLTTLNMLSETILPLLRDPNYYCDLMEHELNAYKPKHGPFYIIPGDEVMYAAETISGNLNTFRKLMNYSSDRRIQIMCMEYHEKLLNKRQHELIVSTSGLNN